MLLRHLREAPVDCGNLRPVEAVGDGAKHYRVNRTAAAPKAAEASESST